jgi:hypothetical protein
MVLSLTVWYLIVLFQITKFLDGKSVKECILGGTQWDISYHKTSGRIVVALQGEGIQFVDNFVAHTKITVQNINYCPGVTWVDGLKDFGGLDWTDIS